MWIASKSKWEQFQLTVWVFSRSGRRLNVYINSCLHLNWCRWPLLAKHHGFSLFCRLLASISLLGYLVVVLLLKKLLLPPHAALPMSQARDWCPTQCVFVKPWRWGSTARMHPIQEAEGSCWSLSSIKWAATAAWCSTMTTLCASLLSPENSASMNPCPQKWRNSHQNTKVSLYHW